MKRLLSSWLAALLVSIFLIGASVSALTKQQSGAVGVEGTIPAPPPSQPAVISTPHSGQTFSQQPVAVAGLCPGSVLVQIYSNGVFVGSANCAGGSFSLQVSLFSGKNDLVAKITDALGQSGPDSATVTVNFNDNQANSGSALALTTAYAKRGAAPGDTLTWPITLSGGTGPYAISVDWGDKSAATLLSRQSAGDMNLEHIYNQAGVFTVVIKATDSAGHAAFLQLVGVGEGAVQSSTAGSAAGGSPTAVAAANAKAVRDVYIMTGISIPLLGGAFWLGQRHQVQTIKSRIRKGARPL